MQVYSVWEGEGKKRNSIVNIPDLLSNERIVETYVITREV